MCFLLFDSVSEVHLSHRHVKQVALRQPQVTGQITSAWRPLGDSSVLECPWEHTGACRVSVQELVPQELVEQTCSSNILCTGSSVLEDTAGGKFVNVAIMRSYQKMSELASGVWRKIWKMVELLLAFIIYSVNSRENIF